MKVIKLFYSIIYTKPSQLFGRFLLTLKRKFNELFSTYLNKRFLNRNVFCAINSSAPDVIFKNRSGTFELEDPSQDRFSLTFLNDSHSFSIPINWHDEALEYGTRLWKLNLHYMEYLEEVNDRWFMLLINDWIKQNTPYKKGYYLDSWNSYALSIRTVVWMQQLKTREFKFNRQFIERASKSIYKQLQFLQYNIEKDIGGNHIIKNIKALLWGSQFFEATSQTEYWRKVAIKLLKEEMNEQILSDGMHFERSACYHNQVTADLLECYSVLSNHPIKKFLKHTLQKMGRVTSFLQHPNGSPSLFNDGGLSMGYRPDQLIAKLKEIVNFKEINKKCIYLPDAGYYGFINNDNYLLCDAGKPGPDYLPAHAHGDIFSFEWTVAGKRIFIDKGVYEYNIGKKREASRSTLSHNTVNIAYEDQCEFWGAFRMARRAKVTLIKEEFDQTGFILRVKHDGYKRLLGKPIHEREFKFKAKTLCIRDTVVGGRGQEAEARFLLHPEVSIQIKPDKLILQRGRIRIDFKSESPSTIIDSVWYPNFGVKRACKQVVVKLGAVPCKTRHEIILLE